jgi:deoxyribodipyrimidine photo-lyase
MPPYPVLPEAKFMEKKIAIHWFRRDLRLNDNNALDAALSGPLPVLPIFIFDAEILDKLPGRRDPRVLFIHQELESMKRELEKKGSSLHVFHGSVSEVFRQLLGRYEVSAVYANRDYEPYALRRDSNVGDFLKSKGIRFATFKDHVIFEKDEVLKNDGTPYTVYTPYSRKWKEIAGSRVPESFMSETKLHNLFKTEPLPFPSLGSLGFEDFSFVFPAKSVENGLLAKYGEQRDIPACRGTSRLGIHLRFGTISIRELTRQAAQQSEVFLNELIWRNFFIQIMAHFPYVTEGPFKKQYAFIPWRNNEEEFRRWCRGATGYPIVDAGMRELNETGFMHNRVRMITASFLAKHLLIDWRWGEAWFAEKLLDFELASNNGNWQWAAGTGCDAAPWFRVFSPELQQQKFDPRGEYIKRWVPEGGTITYPAAMVDHKMARERAIATYKKALSQVT